MKRIGLFLLMTIAICFAAQPVLETIYYGDYGEVCRAVLQFDSKPEYRVERDDAGKYVRIVLGGVTAGSRLQAEQDTKDSRVLDEIVVEGGNSGLTATFRTDGFAQVKQSYLTGDKYKIVLDIFNVKTPSAVHERLSFARFYYKTGFYTRAVEQYEVIAKQAPTMTGIHYYWGMILKNRKNPKEALRHFQMVKDTASEYAMTQDEIKNLGGKSPAKPQPEKPKSAQQKAEPPATPVKTPVVSDDIDSLLVKAANKSDKSPDRLMLAGLAYKFMADNVTHNREDYMTAISLLNRIPAKSPYSFDKYKALAELYAAVGDSENAKLFAGLATDTGSPADSLSSDSFLQIELKLWIALLLMLIFGVIVFFLLMIYYRNRTTPSDDDFTQQDFEYHEELIKEEIEQEKPEEDTFEPPVEEPEPEEEFLPEPEEEAEDRESEARLYFGDDSKPETPEDILREETALTEDEERELLEDEVQDTGEEPRIGDQEYMQKMILKLSQNGWDADAISKELKISVREVEFVLKTNE